MAVAALAAAMTATSGPPAAGAAGIGKARAAAVAKRAASARVASYGVNYPPRRWKADCRPRPAGGWRCAVGTGGQCSGVVTVPGVAHVRARVVHVWCFE
jgi:hypothetical protein